MRVTVNDEAYGWGWRKPVFYEPGMKLQLGPMPDGPFQLRLIERVERTGPEGWCTIVLGPEVAR